jgi:SH3-like domain-containing protein
MPEILTNKSWALATLSVSTLRAIPDDTSELVTQVLTGTPLKVLDQKEKWYQVQTPELYTGWMDRSGLQILDEAGMEKWMKSDRHLYRRISGYAFENPGDEGNVVTDLVLGDLFEVESEADGYFNLKMPDGRSGYVKKEDCISFDAWTSKEPDAASILSVARQMMGSPYLWGGASSKASDCSGFTKLVYYSQGIILARDVSQQARYGEPIDISNIGNLQKGDLLFFGNNPERPGHVGIYLGNGDFIHSSGRVHISGIIPGDPRHDPSRNFVAARRILNSLNTEGITRVGSHTWY